MTKQKNIRVCCGRNCSRENPERLMEILEEHFKTPRGTATPEVDLDFRSCTGYCELGPNIVVDEKIYHHSKTKDIAERIEKETGSTITKLSIDDLHLDEDLL
jgi:NADH:ubiquinone oxidoreductase subunit E